MTMGNGASSLRQIVQPEVSATSDSQCLWCCAGRHFPHALPSGATRPCAFRSTLTLAPFPGLTYVNVCPHTHTSVYTHIRSPSYEHACAITYVTSSYTYMSHHHTHIRSPSYACMRHHICHIIIHMYLTSSNAYHIAVVCMFIPSSYT